MKITGERYVPGMHAQIELEHLHRYYMALSYVKDKVVLDIASGEGYGTAILAERAEYVYGVDISREAVAHAKQAYSNIANVAFLEGSCAAIPLPDASVDFVCSFETIEHHDQHHEMIKEVLRVLKPNGLLMISSPDKAVYSDAANYQNPFHVKELYQDELESLIRDYFANSRFQRQKVFYGSLVIGCDGNSEGFVHQFCNDSLLSSSELMDAPYLLALASNGDLPSLRFGVFESTLENTEQILNLKAQISDLRSKLLKRRGWMRRLIDRFKR